MQNTRFQFITRAVATYFALAIPLSSVMAQEAAPMPHFGIIDIGKVTNSSKKRIQASQELQRFQRNIDVVRKRIIQTGVYMLPTPEFNELAELYQLAKPTPAQQKRIDTLESKAEQVRREHTSLQNVASPTAAQSARLTALLEARTQGEANFKAIQRTLSDRLDARVEELDRTTRQQIREAVAKVAKSKKLSVVFTGDGVLYDTVDITDDVVKEVSK